MVSEKLLQYQLCGLSGHVLCYRIDHKMNETKGIWEAMLVPNESTKEETNKSAITKGTK